VQAGDNGDRDIEEGKVVVGDMHQAAWVEVADSYPGEEGDRDRPHAGDPSLQSARVNEVLRGCL
jgi:hypothetical protein